MIEVIVLTVVCACALSVLYYFAKTGAPPMPCPASDVAQALSVLKQLSLPKNANIYELGSGWGGLAVALAKAFPNHCITGVEISPVPFWLSCWRGRGLKNIKFVRGDFHAMDLSQADALCCYLMIRPMKRLAETLDTQCRPGTPVIAIMFLFRGRLSEKSSTLGKEVPHVGLYFWPARKETETSI